MNNPTCLLCERPMPDTAFACSACGDRARAHLRAVAELTPAGRAVAAGLTRRGPAAGGTGTIRLQLNLAAVARLDAVQNELTTWARHVCAERGEQVGDGDPIVASAHYLAEHVEWIRHREEADEVFADAAAAVRVLTALTDGPAERRWLGQCGAVPLDGVGPQECVADLYAKVGASAATCRTCGTRHEVATRRTWLDELVRGYAYTAREISAAYGIPEPTIRTWAHRRELTASGTVEGRPIYPLGAVLDLAAVKAAQRAEAQARKARQNGPTDPEGRAA